MKTKNIIKWVSLVFFLSLSLIGLAFIVQQVNAQEQTIGDLNAQLNAKGIPIKSLTAIRRIPFDVKIILQSKSNDKNLQFDDLYNAQIARKAATLFFRHGQRIDSYELEIDNSKGESISWEYNHILPNEISQQTASVVPSKLSDTETEAVLRSDLKLHGLSLEKINVSFDKSLGDTGQEVTLQLSTQDINSANRDMIPFLLSVHDSLDAINSRYGTRITVCWIKVFDKDKNQLLDYVWDVETREETSIQAPGTSAWYHVPAATPTPGLAGTKVSIPTVSPNKGIQSYPPPVPTALSGKEKQSNPVSTPTLLAYP